MSELLAIIPFYKEREKLDACLSCLKASTHPIEPFVVDNNVENRGFTKACNIGLREAMKRGHTYAMLLNQDCYLQPDTVEKALAFMGAHPRCAIAGLKQLATDDTDWIIHGGCTEAFPAGRHISGRVSQNDCSVSLPMPWVNGACMVLRIEALYEIGLMDEGYFLIASDADLCFVARQRRWEVWYCADAVVRHDRHGVSSKQRILEELAHFNADQIYFRDKWIGSIGWACLQNPPPGPDAHLSPSEIDTILEKALKHLSQGELVQSEILIRRILDFEPENPAAILVLARIRIDLGVPAYAARALLKTIERVPNSAQTCLALADAFFLSDFPKDSIPYYIRARDLGLSSVELYNNLGIALARENQKTQAIEAWKAALELDPSNQTALAHLRDHAGVKSGSL